MSSTSFYDKILNRLDFYVTPTRKSFIQVPNKPKQSLNFSSELGSSISANNLLTSTRLMNFASSIESPNSKQLLQKRSYSGITDNQTKIQHLEELLHEEKEKNENYLSEITTLKKKIKELTKQITTQNKSPCSCFYYDHKSIDHLLKENEELKKFKENVYVLSKRYDDINENVLVSLEKMDRLFTNINETKDMPYMKKTQTIESSKASFETVINTLIEMMKSKHKEYNFLLLEREKKINELSEEKHALKYHINAFEGNFPTHHCKKNNYGSYQKSSKTLQVSTEMDSSINRIKKTCSCK